MKNIPILILVFILITGCSKDYDLEKSIFIDDPEYPDLPSYTEWGYNTFGAYFDRKPITSNNLEIPLKVVSTNDTTTFLFQGQIRENYSQYNSYYHEYAYDNFAMRLDLAGFSPSQFTDLLVLHDSIIDLEFFEGQFELLIDNVPLNISSLKGFIHFKNGQSLYVDEELTEAILSGLFEMQFYYNKIPYSISEGRFDVGIGENNFFVY